MQEQTHSNEPPPPASLFAKSDEESPATIAGRAVVGPGQKADLVVLPGVSPHSPFITVRLSGPLALAIPDGSGVPLPTQAPGSHVVAYLQWGRDERRQNAAIDLLRGTTVVLPASDVLIQVRNELPATAAGPHYECTAIVSYGVAPASVAPTRTFFLTAGASGLIDLPIPAFATRVRMIPPRLSGPYVLRCLDGARVSRVERTVFLGGPSPEIAELTLPNGATSIQILTPSTAEWGVIFELGAL